LKLTEGSRTVLRGEQRMELRRPSFRPSKRKNVREDSPLLAPLKAWRRSEARAQAVPPYVVFHDSTLAAIAEPRPTSLALARIGGTGTSRLERYGAALLDVVASPDAR
jgi:ATP-dependent DNA helicase RecQ